MTVPLDALVSVFRGSRNTTPIESVPVSVMLHRIRDGTYRQYVTHLRQLLATQGKAPYDTVKRQSMAFTPAGVFAKRANAQITTPSGLLNFDFDHVPALADAKARLTQDPWVAYVFTSPSGDGLKVAVWAEGIADDTSYKHAWGTVLAYFERTYPDLAVANDAHCKDIARLCFTSWDPEAYGNPNALLYAVPPYQAPAPKPTPPPRPTGEPLPADRRERYAQQAIDTAVQMIDASIPPTPSSSGTRHETRLKAARLLGGYVAGGILTHAEAYTALQEAVARNTDDHARSMKTVEDGLRHGHAQPITLEALEAERLDWLDAHRATLAGQARPAVPDMTGTAGHQDAPAPDEDSPQQAGPTPPRANSPGTAPPLPPRSHAIVVTMSDVEEEETQWLWWPYVALGTVAIVDGDPGVGKTLLMTQLAASISLGHPLPDQQGVPCLPTGGPAPTLLLSMEDSLTRTLKPRLVAAGADCTKIHVLTSWLDAQGQENAFTFEHLPFLDEAIQTYHPMLVVIDPVTAYMGRTDIHRANEVQALMGKLNRMAERSNCAIVCIRHPAKPGQHIAKVIHRGLGSVGFIGTARTALFAEEHPTNPAKVLLGQSKSNMARRGRTQLFTKDEGVFQWCGVSRISAEMMGGSGRGPDPQASLEALFWLEDTLKDGIPRPSEELRTDAEEEGIAFRTLRRAKQALQIRSIKRAGEKDQWDWQLPSMSIISPPVSPPLHGPLEPHGPLGPYGPLGPIQQKQHDREQTGGSATDGRESRVVQEDQEGQEGHIVAGVPPTREEFKV